MTNTVFSWTYPAGFGDGKPTSSEVEAVEKIKDLLEQVEDFGTWQNKPDRFGFMWDFDYDTRSSYSGDAVYFWSPVDSDITKFSAAGENNRQEDTVECVVMTLDKNRSKTIANDIAEFISEYYADNETRTTSTEIGPDSISDSRAESQPDRTDHFTYFVQVNALGLTDTGI